MGFNEEDIMKRPDNSGAGWIAAGAVTILGGAVIAIKDKAIVDLHQVNDVCMEFAVQKGVESIFKDQQIAALETRHQEDQAASAEKDNQIAADAQEKINLKAEVERLWAEKRAVEAMLRAYRQTSWKQANKIQALERTVRDLEREGDAGPISG
jgi:hypothetical protein